MSLRSNVVRGIALSFALASAPALASAQAAPAAKAGLPEAKEIFANYNKAIGGHEAFAKVQSLHMLGSMDVQGMTASVATYTSRPNKMLMTITIDQFGEMKQGFDGTVAWAMNPMAGATLVEGEALKAAKDGADFDNLFRDVADFKSAETLEKATIDGKECYKVKTVRASNGSEATECFAVDTHLLVSTTQTQQSMEGPMQTTTTIKEYKEFEGFKFPTQLLVSMPAGEQLMSISKVELNKVDAAVFALPTEVKALIK